MREYDENTEQNWGVPVLRGHTGYMPSNLFLMYKKQQRFEKDTEHVQVVKRLAST